MPRDLALGERRVALTPESTKRLAAKGLAVSVESGAGDRCHLDDADYAAAGARIETSRDALAGAADVTVFVRPPSAEEVGQLREGSTLIAPLFPLQNAEVVQAIVARRLTSLALDLIPRTTVAQMMDVLSSQATIVGYSAVLMAAVALPRFFPMLMTAAGTIAPARVLVLGAGVAGLQAIGTARRLGAVVEAFDVRKAVKEQVESLGAKFVAVESTEDAQTAGGYARDVSDDYKKLQEEAIARHVKTADVVVASALIPGSRAPLLVTESMVKTMKPGSVIVDLAAEQGGNCALTKEGAAVVAHGVTILGAVDIPSRLSVHASQMFSRNVEKFLLHITRDGALALDPKDEIVAGALLTRSGEVVHPTLKARLQ